jgi:hypothetical protein
MLVVVVVVVHPKIDLLQSIKVGFVQWLAVQRVAAVVLVVSKQWRLFVR